MTRHAEMTPHAEMSPRRDYHDAVRALNALQTNHQILQQIRESGGRLNEHSIPEMRAFAEKLGHRASDFDRLRVVHVAGTKGKGSTCAFAAAILGQHPRRLRVGLFTSPHLIEVRERIQIDGAPLAADRFARYFFQVYDGLRAADPPLRRVHAGSPDMPMYFRFLTLMALHAFLAEGVDVAVLEVGVGGEYDSTNVVERPVVCGIAPLGIDHQATLGATIEEIAWHKAGIIKQGVPVFSAPQPAAAMAVVEARAAARAAPLQVVAPLAAADPAAARGLGIPGDHQRTNAALAAALCRAWAARTGLDPGGDAWIAAGLARARWPGRTQRFASPRLPRLAWLVDGAHTPESMAACARWFAAARDPPARCVLLFNAASERDAARLLDALHAAAGAAAGAAVPWAAAVFCPNAHAARADSTNHTVAVDAELRPQKAAAAHWAALAACPAAVLPSIPAAVRHIEAEAEAAAGPTCVLATGSLHLVGGVLDVAKGSL
ncbi:Folylpolyglutamate synthetase [Coemansia javaensis]|uniref:Folylpolyglutamate synthase n=1 Tax=Coemansia javaensis TaxID=2761396 RepID=A0A9W8HI12_9FUNG|nr:Folylpolyglutamate synthetase [Coemansia javaensis]